jgi:hypothetical protein
LPLALTLAIELPVAALCGLRTRPALLAVALVDMLTNPPLNFAGMLIARFVDWSHWPALAWVLVAEIVVVVVEWRLLLWALGGRPRRMLLVAGAMNAASALAGPVFWVT